MVVATATNSTLTGLGPRNLSQHAEQIMQLTFGILLLIAGAILEGEGNRHFPILITYIFNLPDEYSTGQGSLFVVMGYNW